ncbi:transcription initiation factor IID, 31kD subunit-domain-containing protein [Diplogelasinospora grovesii]|uniref:Transcription initiation factor IID, 31kD subunit-domain-containing protein n=1 Tax=Diplogelasinospora grovesii TaxID=303347 RepID=A0AAN6NH49_9PEZI|nr:transcription initiation factor IID, 31kD subunit-domain-containing protein [Diplogelasinospora grovesii]
MSAAAATNGLPPSSNPQSVVSGTQPTTQSSTQPPASSQSQAQQPTGSQQQQPQGGTQPSQAAIHTHPSTAQNQNQNQNQNQPGGAPSSTSTARPRDARTIELLLTAQGVTAYEQRVPLLLLDFAYRHTTAVLSDALHLSADPYTSHAGSKPSAASGAAPVTAGDAAVSANAISLAIASRLGFHFRGGGSAGGGGGGSSKDWLMELARERNRVALPRVAPSEWGVRLPSERFVLSGLSWGLKDVWAGQFTTDDDDESEDEEMGGMGGDSMEGIEQTVKEEDIGGDGVEGGTMGDVFGDDLEDEEMAEE